MKRSEQDSRYVDSAGAAMALSSVSVVTNALRLKHVKL